MIRIEPPTLYVLPDVKLCSELDSLISDIQGFFAQSCDCFYRADLVLSNNTWVPIQGVVGGRRRLDVSFDLVKLIDVKIYNDLIMFTLKDGSVYSLRLTKDFFYFLEWEDDYYN